jgi:hypothetical protein
LSAGDVILRDDGGHGPDSIFAACLRLLHVISPGAASIRTGFRLCNADESASQNSRSPSVFPLPRRRGVSGETPS